MASLPAVDADAEFTGARPRPRLPISVGALLLLAALLLGTLIARGPLQVGHAPTAAPLPHPTGRAQTGEISPEMAAVIAAPQAYKPLTSVDAQSLNAARPLDPRPLQVARPFVLPEGTPAWEQAANCLALANYYEAASEGDGGMRAVSQVVLNRMRHPIFPHSVCGVVFQGAERATGCQFTFTCDGALKRPPNPALFLRARAVAEAALRGRVEASVGMATHYHANFVVPYWADSLDKIRTLGSHIFYVWRGPAGNRSAFRANYAGEPQTGAVPALASLPVTDQPQIANGGAGLALAADAVTLGARAQGSQATKRAYLVADEGRPALKADDNDTTGTLRAQPLLARPSERELSLEH